MTHNLRWDDLQIVLAVAEHRSLSGAARQLGVNHATVLRRIEALERNIGIDLFDRPPGGYRLRAEAQEMLSSLRAISESVTRVERGLTAARLGTGGSFRLTTTDSIANLLLPRCFDALRQQRPGVHVELVVSNTPMDMSRPEAEITIRPTQRLPDGMSGIRSAKMGFAIFGGDRYLVENPSTDHEDHRWIGVAPPLTRSPVGQWQEQSLATAPELRADSFLTIARLMATGHGLAMLPCFVGRDQIGVSLAAAFDDRAETDIWIAAHPDLRNIPQVSGLMEFFAEFIHGEAELLQ